MSQQSDKCDNCGEVHPSLDSFANSKTIALVKAIDKALYTQSDDPIIRTISGSGVILGIMIGVRMMGLDAKYAETLADVITVEYESTTGGSSGAIRTAKDIMREVELE